MAVKSISVIQEGTFKINNKSYLIEICKNSTSEIFNFYLDADGEKGALVSSVYNKYNSKTVGVKKAGEFTREVFGNFEIYVTFVNTLDNARHKSGSDIKSDRKLKMDESGAFTDVIIREGKGLKHTQQILEGNILSEFIEITEEDKVTQFVDYKCIKSGSGVKVKKVKNLDYVLRESGSSDVHTIPIKTMDMIALEKDLSWLENKRYSIIKTNEEFEAYLDRLDKHEDVVGFDTETTGLRINRFPLDHPQRDNLVGICLSIEDHEGVYIPVRHKLFENLDEKYVIEKLRPYLDSKSPKKKSIVTHYGSYDWKVMWGYGINLNIENDTYLLQYMINNSQFKARKDLKSLAQKELGMDMIELDDMFIKIKGRKTDKNFSMLPEEPVRAYAPADADATRLLFKNKIEGLLPTMRFLYWVEVELMKNIAHMEYYGFRLDIDQLVVWKDTAEKEKAKLLQDMFDYVGREFNPNSSKELPEIMYNELKYPVLFYTDKGAPSTGKYALKLLSNEKTKDGKLKYPLAKMLIDYKKQEKLINGFLNKMLKENIDGFIFPSYNQTGTDSGRISCSGPNLQQSPGKQRKVFRSDSDDYYFLIVDYSQVEYRIMAGLAQELEIVDQFKDPEADFHTNMYARMFNVDVDEVTSANRKIGKILNFGLTYGMGPASLALTLYESTAPDKIQDAKELADIYWDSVPNIRDMLREAKDRAYLTGYIETKFGRRRYFPDIRSDKNYIKESNMRRAANTKVQGTGADILKIAHVKLERAIAELGIDAMVKLSMHDELVIQVHKDINPWRMLKLARECMELNIKGFPPLFIGANVGWTWAAGKRDDLEIPVLLTDQMLKEGEHLKEGYDDPEKVVADQIKEFMLNRLKTIMHEKKLNTVEKVLSVAALEKIIKDYFSGFDKEQFVQDILDNKPIHLDEGFVVFNEDEEDFGFDDDAEDDEDDMSMDGASPEKMNFHAIQRMHTEEDRLEMPSPDIPKATKLYKSDYRVMVSDKKCFIKITGHDKKVVVELRDYLKQVDDGVGNQVVLVMGNKMIETSVRLYRVDKLKLLMILDKYKLKQA